MNALTKRDTRNKGLVEQIVRLALDSNLSQSEIAKMLDCSKANVSQVLKRHVPNRQHLVAYKNYRADILALLQEQILSSITPKELQNENLRNKLTAFGILFDKERLERGQSTTNVSVHSLLEKYNTLEHAEQELLTEVNRIKNSLSDWQGADGGQIPRKDEDQPPVDKFQKGGSSEPIEADYDIVIGGDDTDTSPGETS